jgi:hypothetical protein
MTSSSPPASLLERSDNGGYGSLPGLRFASNAVVALPGNQLHHAVLAKPLALDRGFDFVHGHLKEMGRPIEALAGIELQLPRSLTPEAFRDFNSDYLNRLAEWALLRGDGSSRLARTNVAPIDYPLPDASIVAFTFAMPGRSTRPDYVVSGVAEVPDGRAYPDDIIRRGESSPGALVDKMRCVVGQVRERIAAIGTAWRQGDQVHLYSTYDVAFSLQREVLNRRGICPTYGITWHDASPPALELAVEIDVRRYSREITVAL